MIRPYREVAGIVGRLVKLLEKIVESVRLDRHLAEIPKRVRVWNRVAHLEVAEAHPARTVAHHLPGRCERQPAEALQHEHL